MGVLKDWTKDTITTGSRDGLNTDVYISTIDRRTRKFLDDLNQEYYVLAGEYADRVRFWFGPFSYPEQIGTPKDIIKRRKMEIEGCTKRRSVLFDFLKQILPFKAT